MSTAQTKALHMPESGMLEYGYHYCHVTINMVQWILSHDNEREPNDGRRTEESSQRAWMESVQRQTPRTDILLCPQVETESDLSDFGNKVARTDERKSFGEDRGCVRVAGIFSVASQLEAYRLKPERATNCNVVLPCVHHSMLRNSTQQAATGRKCRYDGLWVAGSREDLSYE